jgi:hypothetical protein
LKDIYLTEPPGWLRRKCQQIEALGSGGIELVKFIICPDSGQRVSGNGQDSKKENRGFPMWKTPVE